MANDQAIQRIDARTFAAELGKMKTQLANALPRHLSADRMARIALTEFRKTPKLADCSVHSVLAAVVMASQLGLEPGVMGQGWLVPYRTKSGYECQFIPGWQGFVDLVSRTGRASVWTGAVYDGDVFDYGFGSSPFITHKPSGNDDPKDLAFAYAIGRTNGSEWPVIDVWNVDKIWRHRDRFNKVGNNHYSFEHPEMYARKVPLLQVIKYMPKSIELTTAAALDAAANEGSQGLTLESSLRGDFGGAPQLGDGGEDNEQELREQADELLKARGLNQAKRQAEIGKHKGKMAEFIESLQPTEKAEPLRQTGPEHEQAAPKQQPERKPSQSAGGRNAAFSF